jgi:16S rRNA (adenine1518-N6/adenine1519-N6)-dimethyltransferase
VFDPGALPPLRDVIRTHNLRAEKALGQNFLLDQNLTDKIARLANIADGTTVFEIGPGPGGLTRSLLSSPARHVIAIEYDPRAVAALQDLSAAADGKLTVVQADALTADLLTLAPAPRAIAANLPYNISTVLLIRWLETIRADSGAFTSMTLMFQKEVADRILAGPGNRNYGRLSVMAQWLCSVKRLFDLPPEAFTPPPKINSTVLHFVPRAMPQHAPSFSTLEKILAAAFQQRRKMIRSSLKTYAAALEQTGIEQTLRAEDLSVEDYLRLALCQEGFTDENSGGFLSP